MFAITAQFPRTPARASSIEARLNPGSRLSPDDLSSLPGVSLAPCGVRGNLVDTAASDNGEWRDGRWPTCFRWPTRSEGTIFTCLVGMGSRGASPGAVANDCDAGNRLKTTGLNRQHGMPWRASSPDGMEWIR